MCGCAGAVLGRTGWGRSTQWVSARPRIPGQAKRALPTVRGKCSLENQNLRSNPQINRFFTDWADVGACEGTNPGVGICGHTCIHITTTTNHKYYSSEVFHGGSARFVRGAAHPWMVQNATPSSNGVHAASHTLKLETGESGGGAAGRPRRGPPLWWVSLSGLALCARLPASRRQNLRGVGE